MLKLHTHTKKTYGFPNTCCKVMDRAFWELGMMGMPYFEKANGTWKPGLKQRGEMWLARSARSHLPVSH